MRSLKMIFTTRHSHKHTANLLPTAPERGARGIKDVFPLNFYDRGDLSVELKQASSFKPMRATQTHHDGTHEARKDALQKEIIFGPLRTTDDECKHQERNRPDTSTYHEIPTSPSAKASYHVSVPSATHAVTVITTVRSAPQQSPVITPRHKGWPDHTKPLPAVKQRWVMAGGNAKLEDREEVASPLGSM